MPVPLGSAGKTGSASVQPSGSSRFASRSNRALRSGFAFAHSREGLLPFRAQRLAALGDLPGVVHRLFLDGEVHGRVEVQDLLGGGHLGRAERRAVRGAGVLLVRRGPADDRAEHDERRRLGVRLGLLERVVQRLDVLVVAVGGDPVDVLDVPAVGRVPGAHVLGLGDVRVVLDGDPVVVVQDDQVAELLVAGQRRHLVGDALLDVTVGGEGVDVVVERAGAGGGVGVEQAALAARRHRHAHRVAQALAERPRGDLHARGQPVLRVPRGDAAPRAKLLDVVEGDRVARQVQLDVQREAGMAAGEHEPVAARPLRVRRVVPQEALVEQVGRRGQAHRGAGVPRAGLLHRVHRKHPDQVDGALVGG